MTPTTKLVSDLVAAQACYVNTTHPDFLNGHKAMSIVTERMNQNKPQHAEGKGGKVTPAQLNNNRDLEVDVKEEPSFFGSFFAKNQPKKKGAAVMEAVSSFCPSFALRGLIWRNPIAPCYHQAPGGAQRP